MSIDKNLDEPWPIKPIPENFAGRLTAGTRATCEGAIFLGRNPFLLRYAIWPLLINIAITLFTFALLVSLSIWLLAEVHPWFQSSTAVVADILWTIAEIIVVAGLLMVCVGISVIAWFIVNGVFGGYFYGKLASKVEARLGTDESEFQSLSFMQEATGAMYILGLLVGGNLFAASLNFIPVIGSLAALCLGGMITTFLLGLEFLSHSLGMRGYTQKQQIAFARRNSTVTVGFGAVVLLGQLIPILGAFIHVSATIGGVLLYHQISLRDSTDTPSNSTV